MRPGVVGGGALLATVVMLSHGVPLGWAQGLAYWDCEGARSAAQQEAYRQYAATSQTGPNAAALYQEGLRKADEDYALCVAVRVQKNRETSRQRCLGSARTAAERAACYSR